jgi:hypothetical protein
MLGKIILIGGFAASLFFIASAGCLELALRASWRPKNLDSPVAFVTTDNAPAGDDRGDPAAIDFAKSGTNPDSSSGPSANSPTHPVKPEGDPLPQGTTSPLRELKAASVYITAVTPSMGTSGSGFVAQTEGDTV